MTVKQFSEVAAGRIYLNDFGSSLSAVPGSVLFDAIKDCKICEIESRGGYSATTMRHVNSFLSFYDMNGGGKSWWDMQPVETGKPKAADMTPGESLKAMYNRRAANSMNY